MGEEPGKALGKQRRIPSRRCAARQVVTDRQQLAKHHRQTVERAHYQSELTRGRYESVDHRNRLVAAELERRWESALTEERQAAETLDRFLQQHPLRLNTDEITRITALSNDIPALWHAESTSGVDRQTMLRALVEQVIVEVIGQCEWVAVSIRWSGGFESHHEIRRPVGKFDQLESANVIRARIVALKQQGSTHEAVAAQLNAEQFRSPSGGPFTVPIISQLCRRFSTQGNLAKEMAIAPPHWKLGVLARRLGMRPETLSTWRRRGWVQADRTAKQWLLWADSEEFLRLQRLAAHDRQGLQQTPANLTTPKQR